MVLNTSLVVVIAPGIRPATFRTWKLSPAAPMVLQPTGCGRVGHRHNTLQASGQEPNGSWPLRFPTRKTTVNDRHTHKTTPNEHTRLSGKSPIEYEPHQAAWTNNYRINKASTTCHNPSTPSLNPPAYHSTRPHPQRVRAGNHRSLCAWGMLAAVWLWCDTPTDLCRPHFASWHGMLEAWSLLHIREGRTATGGATRYSPSAWRRTTASPINPR